MKNSTLVTCVRSKSCATYDLYPVVSHVALKPLVKKQLSAWRPIMLRLNLLRQLVSEFGLEGGSDLTSRSIMGFVKVCWSD